MALLESVAFYVVPFLLVLTLVVTVHELGHFWVARLCGTKVERFAIGFGPAIARFVDKDGIEWRFGWLPLGGYVKFAGDETEASPVPDAEALAKMRTAITAKEGVGAEKAYFQFKPVWQRIAIAAAGPVFNFLLSILLFAVLVGAVGEVITPAKVSLVQPGSAAAVAGFKPGDEILQADGRAIKSFGELQRIISMRAGETLKLKVQRGDQTLTLLATPRPVVRDDGLGNAQTVGVLGLANDGHSGTRRVHYDPITAVGIGVQRTFAVVDTTATYLGRIFAGRESGDQLGGPLRIARLSAQVAKDATSIEADLGTKLLNGIMALLSLAAVLSVGLGILNLMPIPVLDGGHIVFYLYEALARKPLPARIQATGYRIGMVLVLSLMVFATFNDLKSLNVFGFLSGLFS